MEKLFLPLERTIAFQPSLARALGGIGTALFVQQIYYWSEKGTREDGFIWKTQYEIEEETCLSYYKQRSIRKSLVKRGVLEEKNIKDASGNTVMHFKLNIPMLRKLISGCEETSHPDVKKLHNQHIHKITTKITTKNSVLQTGETEETSDSQVRSIIEVFYRINPTIVWGNKTTRKACTTMIAKFGYENVLKMAQRVIEARDEDPLCCPVATTPYEMMTKLARFKEYFKGREAKKAREMAENKFINIKRV